MLEFFKGKKIGVLYGGRSSEREVSIRSGKAVSLALRNRGYDVIEIDVGDDFLSKLDDFDVAFVILHGKEGEDGTIQGILSFTEKPFTGPGVLGASLGMNKLVSKKILEYHGVKTPRYRVYRREGYLLPGENNLPEDHFPVVVKPVSEGSTVGVSIVRERSELEEALDIAFRYDNEVLVEEYIEGREITVGVLKETVLPIIEIIPKSGFYDYRSKYTKGLTEYIVPANLPVEVEKTAKEWALIAHKALYQRGVSRSDFRIDKNNTLYFLEVNSIPGMTETSLLPKAAGAVGLSFEDVVEMILSCVI
ncbi:MAG: D-alanine--D-alanine ligase [Thermosulfidibacteraceae bacterium]|jgi:D-alanine-D-alanine ligase